MNCPTMKNQKMFVFCVALVFTTGRCTDEQHSLTETVNAGDDVTLTCSRPSSESGVMFWVKLAPGHLPEVLAATYTFDAGSIKTTPRVSAWKESGTFVLRINKTNQSDVAFYYCEKVIELKRTILNSTFLRVKGPEPDVTAIIQHVSSGPVRPGDSVTLQCSVLSGPDNRTCLEGPSVYWFRAGNNKSHPVLVYVIENSKAECETSSETQFSQKCVYSFSRHISSSDAGTYHCAVATCGHVVFGNGVNLDIDVNTHSLSVWLITVFALSAVSASVTTILIYNMNKCAGYRAVGMMKAVGASDLFSQQEVEDTLIYSAVTFALMTKWWNKKQRNR